MEAVLTRLAALALPAASLSLEAILAQLVVLAGPAGLQCMEAVLVAMAVLAVPAFIWGPELAVGLEAAPVVPASLVRCGAGGLAAPRRTAWRTRPHPPSRVWGDSLGRRRDASRRRRPHVPCGGRLQDSLGVCLMRTGTTAARTTHMRRS